MCFIAPLAQAVAKFCAHKHEATFYQQLNMSRQGPTAPSSNSRNCCGVDGFEEAAITREAGATPNNVQLGALRSTKWSSGSQSAIKGGEDDQLLLKRAESENANKPFFPAVT